MSFNLLAKLLILALISCLACSQDTQFTASCNITNDPNLGAGSQVTVNPIYYDSVNSLMRLDYPLLVDPTGKKGLYEIYNFNTSTVYQLCNTCSIFANPLPLPVFYKETTDTAAGLSTNRYQFINQNNQICNPFQKTAPPSGGISYVWVTDNGLTCRAERTDGTIYNFYNLKQGQPDPSVFVIAPSANCPHLKQCYEPIDLVLVLDESGSIHRDEWALLTEFATGIVNSFVIGPNATQIGLVYFSGVQYATGEDPASCCGLSDPALPLSFDNSTIYNYLLNHQQTGGHTCINCGIKSATTYEPNPNRGVQVPKLMLVLTDGYNNRMTDFFATDILNAKNAGWNIFAIGVGNYSESELQQIASSPNNIFNVSNFNALQTISANVIRGLCSAYPTLPPCGPQCQGKCMCGGQCLCPDTCLADLCSQSQCVAGVAGSACLTTQKLCDPFATNGSLCIQNVCNKTNGICSILNKNCSLIAPDSCYTQSCSPTVGCVLNDTCPPIPNQPGTNTPSVCFARACINGVCSLNPLNCSNSNQCVTTSCDPVAGCISSPINCDDGNACTTDTCIATIGCQHTPIQCPSVTYLNSTTNQNNLCLTFICDPKVGCTSSPKTCNDSNVCTTDSCNNSTGACVNTIITCPSAPNKCFTSSCDAIAGCILTPKNCDDNNFCTIDSCNNSTGACVNTPLTCPLSTSSCSINVCDNNARKCVLQPTTLCNQTSNLCQSTVCINGSCAQQNYQCPLPNVCSNFTCDPIKGCIYNPKNCSDNNPCTNDYCDTTTGNCVNAPIPGCNNLTTICTPTCVTTNPCNPQTCQNGTCVNLAFNCPINKCAQITPTNINGTCQCIPSNPIVCPTAANSCGAQECNILTGICGYNNTRICDDQDPCTIGSCVTINGNSTCSYSQITCPGDSPCSRKKCVNVNGLATCVPDLANTINCTTTGCANATCNPTTGTCQYTASCAVNTNGTCSQNVCNPLTGQCVASAGLICPANDPVGCGTGGFCSLVNSVQTCKYTTNCTQSDNGCILNTCVANGNITTCKSTNVSCDDGNVCTTDQCVSVANDNGNPTSKCVNTPVLCPQSTNPCQQNLCQNVNGVPTCQLTAVVCNSTSKCLTGKCIVANGQGVCQYNETNCGTPTNCTKFVCNSTSGCHKINRCDDHNPCTNDLCDEKTGNCTFVEKSCTNSTNLCNKGVCDPTVGCVLQPIDCGLNVTLDTCHIAVCSNLTGCAIAAIPGSLDACGLCNQPGKCAIARKSSIPAGAIAGAVIGGAVVAGIIALGIGLFAASSGAAAFTPGTQVQMVGGSNNPLYTDGDTGGTNPFEDNDYVPL